ncbi:Protein of unknown function [Bacillus cytotoxicus]|nr:Protein of unknown function [Bacillus cytotoxicus]
MRKGTVPKAPLND